MAFRYKINLIREQVSRERRERAVARMLTVSLLLFAAMLMLTYGVYLVRDLGMSVNARSTELLVKSAAKAGIKAEDVKRSQHHSEQLKRDLSLFDEVVRGSVSWSSVLASLEECCRSGDIRLKRVRSRARGSRAAVLLEGSCTADRPLLRILAFMRVLEENESFGPGKLLSISEEAGSLVFRAEVLLQRPGLPNAPPAEG